MIRKSRSWVIGIIFSIAVVSLSSFVLTVMLLWESASANFARDIVIYNHVNGLHLPIDRVQLASSLFQAQDRFEESSCDEPVKGTGDMKEEEAQEGDAAEEDDKDDEIPWNENSVLTLEDYDERQANKSEGGVKTGEAVPLSAEFIAKKPENQTSMVTSLLGGKVHVYSALARNSSYTHYWDRMRHVSNESKFWDVIVLSGWESRVMAGARYVCCLRYRDKLIRAPHFKTQDWHFLGKAPFEAKQFLCPNVRSNIQQVPTEVSLVAPKDVCPTENNKYLKIESRAFGQKNKIAICAKILYGNLSGESLIEWFEVQKRLCVDKVILYTYQLNPVATSILKHYEQQGFAEMYPFDLPDIGRYRRPVGQKGFQSWNDEQIAVFDCHERLAGYQYVAILDPDEYIIPKKDKNWPAMMKRFLNQKKRAAGFTFKTAIFATSWGKIDNSSDVIITQYLNRTNITWDRPKSIYLPSRVRQGGVSTHDYHPRRGYLRKIIQPEDASIYHYRACRKEWIRKNKCYKTIPRYLDYTMRHFVTPILGKIRERKNYF